MSSKRLDATESSKSWLWWWQSADGEKAKRVNKKCKLDYSAFVNCKRAYGGDGNGKACDALRNQVLHCYSKSYCSEIATAYERCYHLAVNRGRLLANMATREKACSEQIKQMEKCLKRARALPPLA